jgi:hypothetical protein
MRKAAIWVAAGFVTVCVHLAAPVPGLASPTPQHPEGPSDCLGPLDPDPMCSAGSGSSGGSGGGSSCTVTTICRNAAGQETGSVSCTGTTCSQGTTWVRCNGETTTCG